MRHRFLFSYALAADEMSLFAGSAWGSMGQLLCPMGQFLWVCWREELTGCQKLLLAAKEGMGCDHDIRYWRYWLG